jgi:hypothetical protein
MPLLLLLLLLLEVVARRMSICHWDCGLVVVVVAVTVKVRFAIRAATARVTIRVIVTWGAVFVSFSLDIARGRFALVALGPAITTASSAGHVFIRRIGAYAIHVSRSIICFIQAH